MIGNRAGDITLPRKSPLILPCRFPLSCCITTWPLHMQMQTKPLLPVSLRQPPQTHLCLSVSPLLSVCVSLSLSVLQSALATHCLLVGTVPRLAPSQTCSATLDWQNAPSLSTLQIPHTSFHQNACGPLLLLSPALFCTTAEIHTLKVCPPTSQRKIMQPLLLPGNK